jgi:16S rRNA (adenine1518-N6/adenine1519-N6)-dimethyltransferase
LQHRPRKRFSQNFLIDQAVIDDIVRAISPRPDDRLIEIGPGLAALTRPLARIVRPLHVVEIDRDIAAKLRTLFDSRQVIVHEGDALEFDFLALGPGLRVVGNLPYHISTPLLFHLRSSAHGLRDIHAMLQKEVVDRIVAAPGSSDYGRLSVMLQYRFEIESLLDVPPSAFRPAPKVASAVMRMTPKPAEALRADDESVLEDTVARAFAQRRKTLRNTLGDVLSPADFAALDIDPQARAQTLSVEAFVRVANFRTARAMGKRSGPKEER